MIVGTNDLEMLIEPVPVGRFGRFRNELLRRVTVEASYRRKEAPPARDMPPVRAEIGRHALEHLSSTAA